jgi:uroporphyrinogen III methyltransferase/synthase
MTGGTGRIRNVVITRSKEGNDVLGRQLREKGFNPIAVDTIAFFPPEDWSPIDRALANLGSYNWLAFTSATGVEFFARRMSELSRSLSWEGDPRVAAVGRGTAEALERLGMKTSFTPLSYLTRSLAQELPAAPGERVLVLRADIADPAMPEALRKRGLEVSEFAIYRTRHPEVSEGGRVEEADLIVFASPSSVEGLCKALREEQLSRARRIRTACIGPVTAAAARGHGFERIVTPKSQTFDSLLDEIVRLDSDV